MNRLNTPMKVATLLCLFLSLSHFTKAQGTINGVVKDTDGETLIGATIVLEGTATGTTTDINGNYSLSLPSEVNALTISYIGYTTLREEVTVSGGATVSKDFVLKADGLSLDEVVVTGTFGTRSQKSSPISMTYMSAEQIQRNSANSQADILRGVPGITAEGGGGEVASNIFVRGMPSGGQYQFTPLQVDGIPVLSTFGLNSSAHDVYFRNDLGIRSLEFVRGGASTLFGAGSVAGIINYTSVTGGPIQQSKIQTEWAEGGRIRQDFMVSGPLSDNTFYSFSGFYRHDEGPLETGLPTRGHQIRGNIKKYYNDSKSSITFSGQMIDDNVQFYLPYPLANNGGSPERPVGNDGETIYTMLTGQATGYSFDTPNGRFETPIGNGVTTQGGYAMVDLKHSFENNWRLSAKAKAANYNHGFNLFLDGDAIHNTPESQDDYLSDRGLPNDAMFTYDDTGVELAEDDLLFENRVLDRNRPMEEMVGEINLTKEVNGHNITLGTFMSDTKADDDNWIWNFVGDFSNSPRTVSIAYTDSLGNNVDYSTGGFIGGSQTSNKTLQSVKTAFYLADEYKGENFNFDAGVRVERAKGYISSETGIGSNTFLKGEVEATGVAVALAGLYKLSAATNVYANFSNGYFFPELRGVRFSAPGTPQTYETEGVTQAELGLKYGKSNFSGTAALFFVALNDRRSIDFVNDGEGGIIEEVQLQSTQTVGFEGSFQYAPVKVLNVYGNLTYQDHEFTKFESDETRVGNELRRQPNIMAMLGVGVKKGGFDFDLSGNYLGDKFANDANTVELEGYSIVRASGGYTIDMGNKQSLRLGLSVFNLLDSVGITEGSPRQGNDQVGGGEYFVGRPILPRRVFFRATFSI